jgi:hypothetical protein
MSLIKMVQLDPNGLCNSSCWFCPVAYSPNPKFARKNMDIDVLEGIVKQLKTDNNTFVSPEFNFIYTAHYNEVLLYTHFKEMLDVFRKYKIHTMVLTNGLPLTNEKVNLIKEYPDVVLGVTLNIPASDAETWARLTNTNIKMFDKLIKNIEYAVTELPHLTNSKSFGLQVNGINTQSLPENGGWMRLLENAPTIDLDSDTGDLAKAVSGFKKMFPALNVYSNSGLVDRAGYLANQNVLTNVESIQMHIKKDKTKVIGCSNMGNRAESWLHINANGDVFICCNDYDFETIFGNINDSSLEDIYNSAARKEMIKKSYEEFCTTCSFAVWA